MPTQIEKKYASKIKKLIAGVDNLESQAVKRTRKLIDESRERVLERLRDAGGSNWDQYRLAQMKRAVETAVNDFGQRYREELKDWQVKSWVNGAALVDEPLDIMLDAKVFIPEINTVALEIVQAGTADLVGNGLLPDMINKINLQIQLGVMGETSPYKIMTNIGRSLDGPGVYGSIATRAETITRTEIARVQNAANHARMEQSRKAVRGLKKQWVWSGVSRVEHAIAHGQVVAANKKFYVGGEFLSYPLDPAGSAKNTVNCGCVSIPYMTGWPDIDEIDPGFQDKIEKLERKKTKTKTKTKRKSTKEPVTVARAGNSKGFTIPKER